MLPKPHKASRADKDSKEGRELSSELHNIIEEDSYFSKVLGLGSENQLTTQLRDELMKDLTTLVNIVLLENHNFDNQDDSFLGDLDSLENKNPSDEKDIAKIEAMLKKEYERQSRQHEANGLKLLQSLKHNNELDQTAQLALIDDYLSTQKGRRSLRRALQVVKPYFFQVVENRIREEANHLLDGFRFQENRFEVLSFYLAMKLNPDIAKSDLIDRLMNYDPEEEG